MDINTIREKYPQYSDLSDQQLVDGLHKKFYSDIPLSDFQAKIGFAPKEEAPAGSSPILGSLEKGIIGAKQTVKQAQLASLMDLQAADKEKYGETYQGAPSSELEAISARDKAIQDKLREVAQYGIERKEVEAKRGVNPLSKEVENIRNTEAYKNADTFDQLKMYGNALWDKKSDIPGYIAGVGLESLPSSLPTIAAAMAAKFGGMGPKGAAIMGGTGSAFTEFGNQYAELRAEGLDHKEAWEKAGVKSGVIGLFDAASFHSAGGAASNIMRNIEKGAIKQTAKETGKEIGTQALYGMAGEAGGSFAINQKIDPISVIEEGIGEIAGAPLEAATTYRKNAAEVKAAPTINTPAQEKMVVNPQGTLVPNPEYNAAATETTTAPVAPIAQGEQGNLFAPEELPASSKTLTPDTLTGQTETGKAVETAALQAPERTQAEIERNIFALEQQEQTPQVKEQIAALQEQLTKGPGETLDTLKEEFTTLANKGSAIQTIISDLTEKRNATPKLTDKAVITEQIKGLETQLQTIVGRQQELIKEGAPLAKQVTTAETAKQAPKEVAVASDLWELAKPPAVIDEKIMEGLGLTKKAPIRKVLKGLDMNKPEDREAFVDAVNKHTIKGANINSKAVDNYFKWFTPTQETQNAGDTGVGSVGGTNERGVQLPSVGLPTTQRVAAPQATGVGNAVGSAQQPNGGAAPSGEAGPAALTQTVAPTATPLAQTNADLFQAAGGVKKPTGVSKLIGKVIDKLKAFEQAYTNNQLISTQIFGTMQNWGSFDDAYNNLMRSAYMRMSREGDITVKQAKLAIQRASLYQVLFRSKLASDGIMQGNIDYDAAANMWRVVKDKINMEGLHDQVRAYAARTGVDLDTALAEFSKAYEANRVRGWYEALAANNGDITRTEKRVAELSKTRLQKRTGPEEKELKTKKALLGKLKEKSEKLEGLVRHMTRKEMLAGMQLYKANPEIAAGTDIWNTMRERVIKHLVDSGINTEEEARDLMDVAEYVPFQREMDIEEAKGALVSRRGINERMAQPGIKGSMREVANTIENMENWMRWSLSRAVSNRQLRVMLDTYKAALPEEVREGKGNRSNTFSVYEDGKQKFYNVANPAVAQAFTGVDSVIFPSMGFSSKFRRAFTHAYTRIPLVPVAQLVLKDTWEAMVTSGLKHPYMLLAQIPKEAIYTMLGTSEARKELQASGTLSTHEYRGLSDSDEVVKRLKLDDPSNYQKTMTMLDKWSALNDNMLRQAVYAQAKREGKSDAEATMMATEIFNFRRMSGSPTLQWMNNHIPFMNAFGQMQRVTLKALSGSGITPQTRAEGFRILATTTGILAMLSLMYAAAVSDDEDYKKMNRMQRDASFVIPGTGGLRIPIRMGIATIPKILGEYLYHAIADKGYTDPQMFKSAMARAVTQQVMPPMGGLALPAVGLATNHDFVYNREIVNATQRKLEPALQINKNTTEISKVFGERMNVSPLKLDFFFKSYLGAYSSLMALANNSIAEKRGIPRPTAERPVKETLQAIPGMSNFMTKDDISGALSDFYEAAQDVDTIVNSYKKMAPVTPKAAEEYLAKNEDKIFYTKGIETALGKLNTAEMRILSMPASEMSADQKAIELKRINDARKELAQPIREIRQDVYNKKK